jgi:type I restriction enzyme M protein
MPARKASTASPEKKTKAPRIPKAALTTRENLSALIGTARKILRKDKGLNGDVDRLPLLTWVMFLKFLDDLEVVHEEEADLDGKPYQPIIEAPYRWRDWAAREDGITGDELLAFIGQDTTVRADGSKGKGLFAYLRGLGGQGEKGSQREVVANVFKGIQNRMVSGYLLRDIVNKINGIHFSASEEMHTLSHLYESMLREMRDAAGDAGEFYTPRPVVRFMVQVMDPCLGETVLDPACGTGGFLVEAYDHIAPKVTSPDQRRALQRETLFGQEAKPLPYMLAQMNLLLHGLEAPRIAYGNTLDRRINEIGHSERVDLILTNPPFGGEEEVGIKANFPPNMQTAETALLFLQYIMRKLRVAGAGAGRQARNARRPGGRGGAERHALRRRHQRRHQGGTAQGVPPAHHRAPAARGVRALHRHSRQPAVLRAWRPDRHHLVLRAAPARGPQEVQQDGAAAVRRVRCGTGLVERPPDRPAGLGARLCGEASCRR